MTVSALPERSAALAQRVPRELFRRSLARSLLALARTWGGITLAWWLAGRAGSGWALLPAAVLIGTLQYHLNVLGHDGLHHLLAESRRVNDALCRWLLHGPHGAPLARLRRNHLNHHVHFGAAPDLDRQYYDITRFRRGAQLLRWLAASVAGGMTWPIVRKLLGLGPQAASATARPVAAGAPLLDWAAVLVSQAWIALAAGLVSGWWWAYGPLWLVPLFTVMVGLNAIRSCLEHAQAGSPKPALSSFTSHALERFFVAPFHMNVHAEHHLLPAVPWFHLPALRHWLQQHGEYGAVHLHASYAGRGRALMRDIDRDAPAR